MDLSVFTTMQSKLATIECESRKREVLLTIIEYLQSTINGAEAMKIPVIAAVTGHCIGAGIDLICAADLRYCTQNTKFCVKEIDLAIVADMGTVQRLPRLIGYQRAAELCYTGRVFTGKEAEEMGLVMKAFESETALQTHVQQVAETIAKKSPITIRGLKEGLLYTRDHTINDSLKQVQYWNAAMLMSSDAVTAAMALFQKQSPDFEDP
jgi:enoyl-CoA hydratase